MSRQDVVQRCGVRCLQVRPLLCTIDDEATCQVIHSASTAITLVGNGHVPGGWRGLSLQARTGEEDAIPPNTDKSLFLFIHTVHTITILSCLSSPTFRCYLRLLFHTYTRYPEVRSLQLVRLSSYLWTAALVPLTIATDRLRFPSPHYTDTVDPSWPSWLAGGFSPPPRLAPHLLLA